MKKINYRNAAILVIIGISCIVGMPKASAYFTDCAAIAGQTKAGTFKVLLTNYSDLDGNYRTWNEDDTSVSVLENNGLQDKKFEGKAVDADNPSTSIVDPGDTGILQFSLKNEQDMSIDTAVSVVITSNTAFQSDEAPEYYIEGLGTPELSKDRKQLIYPLAKLDIFNGFMEQEQNGLSAEIEHFYAYNVDFVRTADLSFQDAKFIVSVTAFAKQHRHSADSDWQDIGTFQISSN